MFSFYTATEDPICLPVLEVEKEPQVLDKRVRPVGRHEGFSTLHSIAGREKVSIHTRATHMQSKEGAVCVCVHGCTTVCDRVTVECSLSSVAVIHEVSSVVSFSYSLQCYWQ